ncbi:MAG: 2-hydroxyacid dehydrogenase [Alphaproteobacteria bacterium]|nr:2-hydroxyacid dehydrogenase [Alphaproteobacteria bacterium]
MKKTILCMAPLPADYMSELEGHFDVLRLSREHDPEAALQERRGDIVGLISWYTFPVTRHLIESLPNLEIIAVYGVGYEYIDMEAARARGITVTNTPGVLAPEGADTALALMLATARRICEADMYVRVGKWLNGPMPFGVSLHGKTVGILGLGGIGQAVAKRCAAFEMDVVYTGPREKKDQPYQYYADLTTMAAASDFLVITCPGGDATRGIVDYKVLEALGPKGFVINVARGSVINDDDLLAALTNKAIAGAGLDVFTSEPNVPEPLISMDNVVLLPHIGSATMETRSRMARLLLENILAYFAGEPLKTPVAA